MRTEGFVVTAEDCCEMLSKSLRGADLAHVAEEGLMNMA